MVEFVFGVQVQVEVVVQFYLLDEVQVVVYFIVVEVVVFGFQGQVVQWVVLQQVVVEVYCWGDGGGEVFVVFDLCGVYGVEQ